MHTELRLFSLTPLSLLALLAYVTVYQCRGVLFSLSDLVRRSLQ